MIENFWKNRSVLVTGGMGLLGSSLIPNLQKKGASVVTLVRDWVPHSRLIKSSHFASTICVAGELQNIEVLHRILNEFEVNTVFHLGAQAIVGTAQRSPLGTFESNIQGTWNLLEAARRLPKPPRLIVASSDKAYGDQRDLPYHETYPLQARNPYDVSKACADLIARSYAFSYDLPVCVARCGNIFGPGDLNRSRLVPGTIMATLEERPVLLRSDGSPKRDYIYVEDAARAYQLLAEQMEVQEIKGEAFNFSLERPRSVLEMVRIILKMMKREDLEPRHLGNASHEIQDQYLSSAKAKKILGWKSQFSLEEGILKTIRAFADEIQPHRSTEEGRHLEQ